MNTLVHFFGVKRSGNHAVINWLQQNAFGENRSVSFHNCVYSPLSIVPKIIKPRDIAQNVENHAMILSYEDIALEDLHLLPTLVHDRDILPNTEIKYMLLLRDPYNCFASRLKRLRDLEEKNQGPLKAIQRLPWPDVIHMWKSYAREFLRQTRHFPEDIIPINYNQWFSNKTYRDTVLFTHFGIVENRDNGINEVSHHARGSSFDYHAYQGNAQQMETLSRWRAFADDPEFQNVMRDPELSVLSAEIFNPQSSKLETVSSSSRDRR